MLQQEHHACKTCGGPLKTSFTIKKKFRYTCARFVFVFCRSYKRKCEIWFFKQSNIEQIELKTKYLACLNSCSCFVHCYRPTLLSPKATERPTETSSQAPPPANLEREDKDSLISRFIWQKQPLFLSPVGLLGPVNQAPAGNKQNVESCRLI